MQNPVKPQVSSTGNPYELEEIHHKWEVGELTVEQVCGQLLVWIQRLHISAENNERQVENLEGEMADVAARVTTLEEDDS